MLFLRMPYRCVRSVCVSVRVCGGVCPCVCVGGASYLLVHEKALSHTSFFTFIVLQGDTARAEGLSPTKPLSALWASVPAHTSALGPSEGVGIRLTHFNYWPASGTPGQHSTFADHSLVLRRPFLVSGIHV